MRSFNLILIIDFFCVRHGADAWGMVGWSKRREIIKSWADEWADFSESGELTSIHQRMRCVGEEDCRENATKEFMAELQKWNVKALGTQIAGWKACMSLPSRETFRGIRSMGRADEESFHLVGSAAFLFLQEHGGGNDSAQFMFLRWTFLKEREELALCDLISSESCRLRVSGCFPCCSSDSCKQVSMRGWWGFSGWGPLGWSWAPSGGPSGWEPSSRRLSSRGPKGSEAPRRLASPWASTTHDSQIKPPNGTTAAQTLRDSSESC